MSTIFVGKWDRFATDFVVADKIGRIVGETGGRIRLTYPKTTRLQMANRVSNNARIIRYFGLKTIRFWFKDVEYNVLK